MGTKRTKGPFDIQKQGANKVWYNFTQIIILNVEEIRCLHQFSY